MENSRKTFLSFVFIVLSLRWRMTGGHGRLVEPPARGTMWRLGFDTPPNYNDHQLFCGGFSRQWMENGGRCGECGDPWDMPRPRPNEAGGVWGTGTISKAYREGQIMTSTVHLTANHMGWFEFRLCPNDNPKQYVKQSCLNKHVLKLVDHPGTRYQIRHSQRGLFRVRLQLPPGLTCSQCVLQWHYTTGNNWGFCKDGANRAGCGAQEVFRGCSDVAVFSKNDPTYFQYLNLTTEADLGQFLETEGHDIDHQNIHDHHEAHHHIFNTNDFKTESPNTISQNLPNQVTFAAVDDGLLGGKIDPINTPPTPILSNSLDLSDSLLRNPNYFNDESSILNKIDIYNKYISSDSFRKNRNRNPSNRKKGTSKNRQRGRPKNRPSTNQVLLNQVSPNPTTTTHSPPVFDNSPNLLNALAAVLHDPPSQAITESDFIELTTRRDFIEPTTIRPSTFNAPTSITATTPITSPEFMELSKLLGMVNPSRSDGKMSDSDLIERLLEEIGSTMTPSLPPEPQRITTRRNFIPKNIPGVNQFAFLPQGQNLPTSDPKPSAVAFQVPLSELNNVRTLERLLMLQRAFDVAANGGQKISRRGESQQEAPLVFIVV